MSICRSKSMKNVQTGFVPTGHSFISIIVSNCEPGSANARKVMVTP